MSVEVPIEHIEVRDRSRLDVGDVTDLASSIQKRGLLHPPVVRRAGDGWILVAGERRLAALRSLGRVRVEVTVARELDDEYKALLAEGEENTERRDFSPEEAVRHRKRIEAIVAAAAKVRQRDSGGIDPGCSKLEQPAHERKTRHITAKGTGYSASTLDKAEQVIRASEDESLPEPVREVAQVARAKMNETGKVDPSHRMVRDARVTNLRRSELDDVEARGEAAVEKLRIDFATRHEAFRLGLLGLDPEKVAAAVSTDADWETDWRMIESTREMTEDWFRRLFAARPKPFSVVSGGQG